MSNFDVQAIRAQFPILSREVNGKPLAYFDSAASAQKPQAVIDAQSRYLAHTHSNIHRGVHALAQEATEAYEAARETVRGHIGAASTREILFVGGTTDGINLVAQTWGRPTCPQATASCLRGWSTTATSCLGKCSPSSKASTSMWWS